MILNEDTGALRVNEQHYRPSTSQPSTLLPPPSTLLPPPPTLLPPHSINQLMIKDEILFAMEITHRYSS